MTTKNCDKYVKNGKYGIAVFSIIIIIGILKKTNVFNTLFGNSFDTLAIVVTFIVSMLLLMPYITCISKYKKQ